MSNVNIDVPLANSDYKILLKRRKAIAEACLAHGDIYFFADTETTGTEIVESKSGKFNRMLEWSGVFAFKDDDGLYVPILDEDGELVVIDEPINFFIEKQVNKKQQFSVDTIPSDSIRVHGITIDYLFAESAGEKMRPKLSQKAGPFTSVYYAVLTLIDIDEIKNGISNVYMGFHNSPFDIKFLNHECEMNNLPYIENYVSVLDSLATSKRVFKANEVSKFTLDAIFEYGLSQYPDNIKKADRPIHTALIDSLILLEVFNTMACKEKERSSLSIF